jgi:hypothetical protein
VEWRGLIVAADFSCNLLGVRNSAWNDDPTSIASSNDNVEEHNLKPAVAKINRVSVVAVVQDQDRKVRIWFCGSFTWKDGAKICEVDQ